MGNETSRMEDSSHVDVTNIIGRKGSNKVPHAHYRENQDGRSKKTSKNSRRTSLSSQDGGALDSSAHNDSHLNSGRTLTYAPNHPQLHFPSSSSCSTKSSTSLPHHKRRQSQSSASSTSSRSTKSSSTNKRAMLVSSGDILEPPTKISSFAQNHQSQQDDRSKNDTSRKAKVMREVDFVNMNVSKHAKTSIGEEVHYDQKLKPHKKGRGRGLFQKVFKGGHNRKQKRGNHYGNITDSDDRGIINNTKVAAGSSGFIQPEDYQNLNRVAYENEIEDEDYGYHYDEEENDLDCSVLPSDRLQRGYNLHDDGRLPTILDVSYQSSTMNVSVDHEDEKPLNLTSLLGEDNNQQWEEEDTHDVEYLDEQEDNPAGTPVNSVVTEEAYELKSKFSSCTKSIAHHEYNEKKLEAVHESDDGLNVNESDYTANLNSFLDKVHASYDAEGEQINDIQTPMVRLGDLFGDMTLNNSRYQHLDSSLDQEDKVNTSVQSRDLNDITNVNEECDPRIQALDILHETLEEREDSPSQLLKEFTNKFESTRGEEAESCTKGCDHESTQDENEDEREMESSMEDNTESEDEVQKVLDFLEKLEETHDENSTDEKFNGHECIRENSPMPQMAEMMKAPTSPSKTNLLPEINRDDGESLQEESKRVRTTESGNVDPVRTTEIAADNDYEEASRPQIIENVNASRVSESKLDRHGGVNQEVNVKSAKDDPVNITEIAVNGSLDISKDANKDPQIGIVINIAMPSQIEIPKEKRPVTYSDASTIASTVICGKKDAFTQEAMKNGNFLFAGGPRCSDRVGDCLTKKIDEKRLSLINTKDASEMAKSYEGVRFDPLQLIQNAKLELEERKKNLLHDGGKKEEIMSRAVEVENKVEVKLGKQDLALQKKFNDKEEYSHGIQNTPPDMLKNEDVQVAKDDEEKEKRVSINTAIDRSYSPRDSLEEILEEMSLSELEKRNQRNSAITPMKSHSPYVRFKKAQRLFGNEGDKVFHQQKSFTHESYKEVPIRSVGKEEEITSCESREKRVEEIPSINNESSVEDDFILHRRDSSTQDVDSIQDVDNLDHLAKAPHTLQLLTKMFSGSVASTEDESSSKSFEVDYNDHIMNDATNKEECTVDTMNAESVDEVLSVVESMNAQQVVEVQIHDTDDTDIIDNMDIEENDKHSSCGNESGSLKEENSTSESLNDDGSKQYSTIADQQDMSVSGDSPYDENDELSIAITPEKSVHSSSVSSMQLSSERDDSLNTSPLSTESEDVFATLLKNATAASPDASMSLSSASSSVSSSTYSLMDKSEPDVLKSVLKNKKKYHSDSLSPQNHLHSVRWSLANLDEDKGSKHRDEGQTNVNPAVNDDDEASSPTNTENEKVVETTQQWTNQECTLSVYDESVSINDPSRCGETDQLTQHGSNSSPHRPRGCIFSPGEESSRVSVTPPPLSKSVRAAVNPRDQQIHRMNTVISQKEEKENIHSSNVYSSPSTTSAGEDTTICTYSPLEMSKGPRSEHHHSPRMIVKPQSPSALCLSPLQRTPMQARKWRTLAAQAEEKKKNSIKKNKRKSGNGLGRTPLGKLKNRRNIMT